VDAARLYAAAAVEYLGLDIPAEAPDTHGSSRASQATSASKED